MVNCKIIGFSFIFLALVSNPITAQGEPLKDIETPEIKTLEKAQQAAETLIYLGENEITKLVFEVPQSVDLKATSGMYHTIGINLGRGRTLACEALLCAVGIAIPESHSECVRVLRNWSIYLATLSIFSSTPKCPSIDAQGNVTGHNDMTCGVIQDVTMRNLCLEANNQRPAPNPPPRRNPCEGLEGFDYQMCIVNQCNNNRMGERQLCQIE